MKNSVAFSGKYKCIVYHTYLIELENITPNDDSDPAISSTMKRLTYKTHEWAHSL
jgi:hypothetical protein